MKLHKLYDDVTKIPGMKRVGRHWEWKPIPEITVRVVTFKGQRPFRGFAYSPVEPEHIDEIEVYLNGKLLLTIEYEYGLSKIMQIVKRLTKVVEWLKTFAEPEGKVYSFTAYRDGTLRRVTLEVLMIPDAQTGYSVDMVVEDETAEPEQDPDELPLADVFGEEKFHIGIATPAELYHKLCNYFDPKEIPIQIKEWRLHSGE